MAVKFNYVKKGYEPSEVDEYIENLENIIKSYKEKDTAIKNAILNAQIAADNIVQNAKYEAADIKSNAINQLNNITSSVSLQREMLDSFRSEYSALAEKYLHTVIENDISKVSSKLDSLEKYLRQFNQNSYSNTGTAEQTEQISPIRRDDKSSNSKPANGKPANDKLINGKTTKSNEHSSDSLTVPNPLNSPTLK